MAQLVQLLGTAKTGKILFDNKSGDAVRGGSGSVLA